MLSFHKPKNKFLSKYIEGYYFLKSDQNDFSFAYFTFPNNFQIVSFAIESRITLQENSVISRHSKNANPISTLTYNYSKPIRIQYHGKVNEITVYFKPLGLNHFVDQLEKYYSGESFVHFIPFDDFQYEMKRTLSEKTIEQSIDLLEKYWVDRFTAADLDKIQNILALLDSRNIQEAADELKISRQYIHKILTSCLGKTPIEYRRLQRFRNAIDFSSCRVKTCFTTSRIL
ncbi:MULTISPECIES: AraC family transcriptional regulator [Flavobacterium]|uniref:AraC family transcriptional regulator n=1 Tax=Flavobacterium TaxID=237 RepID=UPI0011845EF0|nr:MULTISPECIES: AraC family transcriptional regulator [Flavobacterium]MCR4032151.1 AraC family transcriptional regulator [Flavobacterium panacis]